MAALFSEALDFALNKTGKDSDFKLKTDQKSILEYVVAFFFHGGNSTFINSFDKTKFLC